MAAIRLGAAAAGLGGGDRAFSLQPLMLVVDASVVLRACAVEDGFEELQDEQLVAPPLMWSEARSVLHELAWRRELDADDASVTHGRLESCPVGCRADAHVGPEAWRLAGALGWAKTYDAEYVALASLLDCRLVTLDGRLRRRCDALGFVVAPGEL